MEPTIYKHRYVITVLSEERHGEDVDQYSLEEIQYRITQGPDLGEVELESVEEITDWVEIEDECIAVGNDGGFFTESWIEWEEEFLPHWP